MIGANEGYSCAVVAGALKCWDGSSLAPSSVLEVIPSEVARLSSGAPQCVVTTGGAVKCWSFEYQQQEKRSKLVVQDISGLKGEIGALSAAGSDEQHFACAVDSEGLKCWGNNFAQPLGRRPGGVRNLPPAPIAVLETGVTAVATELNHSCAIKEGKVYCWGGFNFLGELGDNKPQGLGEVVAVDGVENATQIGVGPGYSCALTRDSRVFCWGDNEFGQTGNISHDTCQEPNGHADAIKTPCNRHPVEVRGLP
jgi:alpha-tubulin suppressor-like RCC1 family protein